MIRLPGDFFFKINVFLVIALCIFRHRNLDMLKTMIDRSFTLEQLIEDNE